MHIAIAIIIHSNLNASKVVAEVDSAKLICIAASVEISSLKTNLFSSRYISLFGVMRFSFLKTKNPCRVPGKSHEVID